MFQWAEIRQMPVVDGVPKKQITERLGLDIKTVRRAVAQAAAPQRQQPGGSSPFQPFKNPTMNRPPACIYLLYVVLDQYYLLCPSRLPDSRTPKTVAFNR